jgi:hypothetical protein
VGSNPTLGLLLFLYVCEILGEMSRFNSVVGLLGAATQGFVEQYVDRLLNDEGESFPSFVVFSHFAQLCALARSGLLTTAIKRIDC